VSIIRRRLRAKGKVEEIGDWLEWTSDGTSIHITVRPGNGRTTIQFMGDAGFRLVGTYGPITLATLITLVGLGNSGSLGIGLAVTILAGAYLLARTLWGAASRAAGRMYRRMIDDITGDVARLVDAASRDDGPT
jgi:hypothetical protein